jgi:hypothetical protein
MPLFVSTEVAVEGIPNHSQQAKPKGYIGHVPTSL